MSLTDEEIRRMAKERVDFKQHAAIYAIINAMLTGIWYFTGGGYFWPAWTMLFWGVGLAFHAWNAYSGSQASMVSREEEKLRRKYQ